MSTKNNDVFCRVVRKLQYFISTLRASRYGALLAKCNVVLFIIRSGEVVMGVRSVLKKELMGLDDTSLLAADDVRALLTQTMKAQPDKSEQGFALISRFNDNHSQLAYGEESKEELLEYQVHRLFKDILYTRRSVDKWLSHHLN
jgi:hypothetical protein